MEIIWIIAVIIGLGLLLYSKLSAIEQRIKQQEKRLQQLIGHAKIEKPVSEGVLSLLRQGKDVQAVKAVREQFGYSLLEAKQYVDEVKKDM